MNDDYRFARLKAKFRALGKAHLELGHVLKTITQDLNDLKAELRSAQSELARLKQLDRARRAERDDGAPLQ